MKITVTEDLCPNGCIGYCRMLREYSEHWERVHHQRSLLLTVDRKKCTMRWRFAHQAAPTRPILKRPT